MIYIHHKPYKLLFFVKMKHNHLIDYNVNIFPYELDGCIEESIKKKTELLKMKQIKSLGIILDINRIIDISENNININGTSIFKVRLEVQVYLPEVNEIIKTKIKSIEQHGIYVDEPLRTFVCMKKIKGEVGDIITIKVTKVSYNTHDNELLVIAQKEEVDSIDKNEKEKKKKKNVK